MPTQSIKNLTKYVVKALYAVLIVEIHGPNTSDIGLQQKCCVVGSY